MTSVKIFSEQSLQEIFLNILQIVNYKNDREAFVQNFIKLCLQETLLNYLESLPPEKQALFRKELKDQEIMRAIDNLKKFIDPVLYKQIYFDSCWKMILEYTEEISPSLNSDQKEKLDEYLTLLRT